MPVGFIQDIVLLSLFLSSCKLNAICNFRAVHYDLFAVVCHIEDPRTGGNLVAHIKVGETYHLAKEVGQAFCLYDNKTFA